ncbi:hypothetical protein [Sandaracinus amylolyticus]|uniref:Uncharacterized protein n=1 Tax=Sandaracinus amylolyticus TaxID=927083 RepID=A0A0F6W3Q0_9BACT|nr:hypothetical protein [Sandaracinus amylolyticus]AKF06630.1 hypothetical protein DB32_003779 [Sandaracinus amylolyticus]
MSSKQVADRDKSARAVVAAITQHRAAVEAAITATLSPYLERGERMPDVGFLLELVGRRVAALAGDLTAADRTHERELADDAAPRTRRDEAAATVRRIVIALRATVEGNYGDAGLQALGLWDPPSSDAHQLRLQGESLVEALLRADVVLPAPESDAIALDRRRLAARLREPLDALGAALADVTREEKEADATQLAKNAAMDAHDHGFPRLAGLLAALARAAGLDDLAARMRPSGRRAGTLAGPEEPPPSS